MQKEATENSEKQARAQLESVVRMVKRLEHCGDCEGYVSLDGEPNDDNCTLTDQEIIEGTGYYYEEGEKATDEQREDYHNEDKARQAIEEDALSVQCRSGWAGSKEEFEAEEFEVLLCTGGPACRIVGELDRGEPSRARIEHQDWFTPWVELVDITSEEREALVTYCQQFYFGE